VIASCFSSFNWCWGNWYWGNWCWAFPKAPAKYRGALPTPSRHLAAPVFRVVIDPGHGGSDEGTVYYSGKQRIAEKWLTLQLAKRTARQLRARGYFVTLTRQDDRDVPLGDRTQLANSLGADVFISLHINSSENLRLGSRFSRTQSKEAEGIETYILNNTTDASSRRLAQLENSVLPQTRPKKLRPRRSRHRLNTQRLAAGRKSQLK
jgi:N-acetylmuramoyl-L-alanine amidase